jgi:acyl-CoA thioester hydrolase
MTISLLLLRKFTEDTGVGPILASTERKFRLPLTYPDTVSVGTRVSAVEADRFLMKYVLVSHGKGKVAAEGEGLIVSYDYRALRKAPLPEEMKERIQALEQSAQP